MTLFVKATVIPTSTNVAHVFVGGVVTVQGVTTGGATALNCTGCLVTAVNNSTGAISYTIASTMPFSGLSIAPWPWLRRGVATGGNEHLARTGAY